MILGKKFIEYTDYVEPLEEDYNSDLDYLIAKTQFNMKGLVSFDKTSLKTKVISKLDNIELRKGNKVFIKRWDDNGIDGKTLIIDIMWESEFPEIICQDGYFIFNPNEEYNEFTWTSKGRIWEKKYQKWIRTNSYYIEK